MMPIFLLKASISVVYSNAKQSRKNPTRIISGDTGLLRHRGRRLAGGVKADRGYVEVLKALRRFLVLTIGLALSLSQSAFRKAVVNLLARMAPH